MLALGSECSIHVLALVFIKGRWAGWKEQWLQSQVTLNLNPVWVTYQQCDLEGATFILEALVSSCKGGEKCVTKSWGLGSV